MSYYISLEAAITTACTFFCEQDPYLCEFKVSRTGEPCQFVSKVNDIPAADVMPVVHGEWLETEDSYADPPKQQTCMCSVCKKLSKRPLGDFCRWCGACMLKVEQEQEYEF